MAFTPARDLGDLRRREPAVDHLACCDREACRLDPRMPDMASVYMNVWGRMIAEIELDDQSFELRDSWHSASLCRGSACTSSEALLALGCGAQQRPWVVAKSRRPMRTSAHRLTAISVTRSSRCWPMIVDPLCGMRRVCCRSERRDTPTEAEWGQACGRCPSSR